MDNVTYGPKMQALTPMQRRWVEHYVESGGGNATESARMAGHPEKSARNEGYRHTRDPRVVAAVREETERLMALDLPGARQAMLRLVRNEAHKDHFAAAKLWLGTQGISAVSKTEHVHSIDTQSLAAQIRQLEAQLPADMRRRLAGPTIIDVTPEEDWTAP